MCCKAYLLPATMEMSAMLLQVGFVPIGPTFFREFDDGKITASYEQRDGMLALSFSLMPNITSMGDHARVSTAASALFKVADRIAERFEASLIHDSNVALCRDERGSSQGLLAAYPEIPFRFEALCLGFRTLFSKEGQ